MRSCSDRATNEVSRSTCITWMVGKNNLHVLCRGQREITLNVLLVNCHDVTGRIFDPWISRQTGMKSPLKWHNQPGRKMIIKDFYYLFGAKFTGRKLKKKTEKKKTLGIFWPLAEGGGGGEKRKQFFLLLSRALASLACSSNTTQRKKKKENNVCVKAKLTL